MTPVHLDHNVEGLWRRARFLGALSVVAGPGPFVSRRPRRVAFYLQKRFSCPRFHFQAKSDAYPGHKYPQKWRRYHLH